MSTGNIALDILLNQIKNDAISKSTDSIKALRKRYRSLSEKEAEEIHGMLMAAANERNDKVALVVTSPPSFAIQSKTTKVVVNTMINSAEKSILITGYSLSDYFSDMIDCIIRKSQQGILIKFYVNDISNQNNFDRLYAYKGRFLEIYNYSKPEDSMSTLHAKVISVDQKETLITSANLSYHGQEGNIELGAHIISKEIAKQVEDVFTQLVFAKVFKQMS